MFVTSRNLSLAFLIVTFVTAGASAQDALGENEGKAEGQSVEAALVNNNKQSDAKRFLAQVEEQIQSESDAEKIFELTLKAGPAAYLAGDMAKARTYGGEILKRASELSENWNYGNAVHVGNIVMGLVELTDGKDSAAKKYLLAAGRTPGSPQLNSFGPNMLLARDFLAKGEREIVFSYMSLCAKFWKGERGELSNWKAAIDRNEMPSFGPHLEYHGF